MKLNYPAKHKKRVFSLPGTVLNMPSIKFAFCIIEFQHLGASCVLFLASADTFRYDVNSRNVQKIRQFRQVPTAHLVPILSLPGTCALPPSAGPQRRVLHPAVILPVACSLEGKEFIFNPRDDLVSRAAKCTGAFPRRIYPPCADPPVYHLVEHPWRTASYFGAPK